MPLIFQYGSNTDGERLNSAGRLDGAAEDRGRAVTLDEYEIAFDVWSNGNDCAASDLVEVPGSRRHAWGVLFEVPENRLFEHKARAGERTLERIEGRRYRPQPIRVQDLTGREVEATTFLVKPAEREPGLWTSADYVGHIVRGLRAHGVPADYVERVIAIAIRTNVQSGDSRADEQSKLIQKLSRRS